MRSNQYACLALCLPNFAPRKSVPKPLADGVTTATGDTDTNHKEVRKWAGRVRYDKWVPSRQL